MYHYFLDVKAQLVASSNGSVFNNLKTDIVKSNAIALPSKIVMDEATKYYEALERLVYANAKEQLALAQLKELELLRLAL